MMMMIYLGVIISSTESDINIRIGKAWKTIERSDLPDEIKREFCSRISANVWLHHFDCVLF